MDVQRSLAAIVFTDVVGYSALVAADEAKALRLFEDDLALMRSVCTRNDGQILKTMGDGVLMVFGSAVQAVSSALEFQRGFSRPGVPASEKLVHRIGIHVGDVLLSQDDAQGDGVNVASRLLDGAPPGGIWASGTVYDIVKGRVQVRATPRGNQKFKNLGELVTVYELSDGYTRRNPFTSFRLSKSAPVWGMVFLSLALVLSAGIYYLASLHPKEVFNEKVDYVPLPGSKAGSAGPAVKVKSAVTTAVSPGVPAATGAAPSSHGVRYVARATPEPSHPLAQGYTHDPVISGGPSPANTAPAGDGRVAKPAATGGPPSGSTPSTPQQPDPNSLMAMQPNSGGGFGPGSPFDVAAAKTHYAFSRYVQWLQNQPESATPTGKRELTKWRSIVALKQLAVASLTDHTREDPLQVTTDGPGGHGMYRIWAANPLGNPAQPNLQVMGPDGANIKLKFWQLTSAQLDAVFVAVGLARYPSAGPAPDKRVFQWQLNNFESEYGLPRSILP